MVNAPAFDTVVMKFGGSSVADPEKEMTSPTLHVVLAVGVVICAVGPPPTLITIGALVLEAPWPSVTLRRAEWFPDCMYVKVGCGAVESSKAPSPSRSQAYVSDWPVEPVPSKWTVSGPGPLVGEAVATAVGPLT